MIIESRVETIEYQIRLSDYCKGCPYKELAYEEWNNTENVKRRIGRCVHGNACDHLYRKTVGLDHENTI